MYFLTLALHTYTPSYQPFEYSFARDGSGKKEKLLLIGIFITFRKIAEKELNLLAKINCNTYLCFKTYCYHIMTQIFMTLIIFYYKGSSRCLFLKLHIILN